MLTPIMLRSFGRSGSTLLMQVLGSSTNVVFDRDYPFEKRHLTYLYRLSTVASNGASNNEDWNPDTLFDPSVTRIGPIPYAETSIVDREKLRLDYLMRLWNGFSHQIKNKLDSQLDNEKPIYYAEKVVHDICADVNKMINAKNLFLLRDPRDEFISVKSFNAKRGFYGFGWKQDDTDESYALRLCEMRRSFMRHVAEMESDNRRMFLKYEDFMCDPYGATQKIGAWLGLDLDYGKVLENKKSVSQHITSTESVVRWKSEMSKSLQEIFSDRLGNELCALGYGV